MSAALNPALLQPATGAPAVTPGTTTPARDSGTATQTTGPSFADVLKQATAPAAGGGARRTSTADTPASQATAAAGTTHGTQPLRFSKHALERAQRRGIQLDASTLGRLQEGVGRIADKGSRDSLVLVDGNAFVVSVPNRTVITAVGSEHMREHVFTNIDSAVIA